MLKVNIRHTRTRCELLSKLASKCRSEVFTPNFEHISELVLVFLLLNLNTVEQYIKLEKKMLLLYFQFKKC